MTAAQAMGYLDGQGRRLIERISGFDRMPVAEFKPGPEIQAEV